MVGIVKEHIRLDQFTTLKVGGAADYVIEVTSEEELKAALQYAKEHTAVPPLLLGGGSNVLIGDAGYPGVVIIIRLKGREYTQIDESNYELACGAGEVLDEVIAETTEKNLWGLENLSGIPGTVGATPIQNVGAYGVEVSAVIKKVFAINIFSGEEKVFSNDACDFLYRDSFFKTEKGKEWVLTKVVFTLTKKPTPHLSYADLIALQQRQQLTALEVREAVLEIRGNKFPDWNRIGTAGSFFKNPLITKDAFAMLKAEYPAMPGHEQPGGLVKVSLGFILDKVLGLRGYCEGSVCLYEKQALVLVNNGNATATEIKNFSEKIIEKVFLQTKIKIEREVLCI